MGLFDRIGQGVSKGWRDGNDTSLGPVGGLLGAFGGGMQGLFGGQQSQGAPSDITVGDGWRNTFPGQQAGQSGLGDKLNGLASGLNAAQQFSDGDWASGAHALGGIQGIPGLQDPNDPYGLKRRMNMHKPGGQY